MLINENTVKYYKLTIFSVMEYNIFKQVRKGRDKMQVWFVVSLLFSIIIAVFAALNSDVVTIQLFFARYELSQSIVIILSAVLGAVITIFFGLFGKLKSLKKTRELNSEIKYYKSKNQELNDELKKKDIELASLKVSAAPPEGSAPPADKETAGKV
jgi:lipopolysaccharide assembly protein A